ncbi:hypothetical protein OAG76_01780 [Rubripirellula sp.]|nr:hypothetical protein [Rubripirellula sp.]MDB4634113.1 hypothetical protein [Rubripirellula sp.]MDC0288791.1 hypothetical protein [Rubripirellula sp.]
MTLVDSKGIERFLKKLQSSPLHEFSSWPNKAIPNVCAGVYAIYESGGKLIYVGMAGAALTPDAVHRKTKEGKKSGLLDRLNSHATGYRSGDRFNIYIGDLYLLRTLTSQQIEQIASGTLSFDSLIKEFIRRELCYRYVVAPYNQVRRIEAYIQTNGLGGFLPTINGRVL